MGERWVVDAEGIADIFIDNINHASPFYIVAAALLSLNSLFSYPIIAYPPVLCIVNLLKDGEAWEENSPRDQRG